MKGKLRKGFKKEQGYSQPRLSGGDNLCSGRVEIRHGGTWATQCDAHFDLKAASVICKELECGTALSIPSGAHFGEGRGLIRTEEFQCVGNESHLAFCPTTSHGNQTCSHANDASIICSGHTVFRLVNGSRECSGRVEIQLFGDWGTLCDSGWDLSDANVLCHQLDCGVAVSTPGGGYFGSGKGSVWTDTFHCKGTESFLRDCPVTALGASPCPHGNHASVICSGRSESFRLWNGESRCDGRVEISLRGVWSRVLDDQWDVTDASVVCRELQCGVAEKAYNPSKSERGTGPVGLRRVQCVGNETLLTLCNNSVSETAQAGIAEDVGVVCSGSGQIWLDDVKCTGNESELWECPSRGWGQHNCRHKEDAGVLCSGLMDLRLVNGSACTGRLEVFYNGMWGSVCNSPMDAVTRALICKHLDCGESGTLLSDSPYGTGSGPRWVDGIRCEKHHSSLWQCQSAPWSQESCSAREETHISCEGKKGISFAECPNSTSCTDQEKLRLVGGEDRCSGRVEVWYHGSWGTVCDDSWDMVDAHVVCKQLGCGAAVSAPGKASFGAGTGPIWVEKVNCKGTELSLWDCPAMPWGASICGHREDAAVNCSGVTLTTAALAKTDLPSHRPSESGRVTVPVIICIILGVLLCVLIIILGMQVQRARAQRRGATISSDPVYEDIDYNLMREKQKLSRAVSYAADSVTKQQYYNGDSDGETNPRSEQEGASPAGSQLGYEDVEEPVLSDAPLTSDDKEAPAQDGDVPANGYDDVRDISDPEDNWSSGQNTQEVAGVTGVNDKKRDSQRDWSLHSLRIEGASRTERVGTPLPPEDLGYDDVEAGVPETSV
ncbi:scavenger receptor cysteine-rich type 1 protein M130-like [Carettochelys insculpta]|uniref:scavenger receptor cysteine-rich type 1 protein M130-like n=1 Tax=Carettochelys insculpta TaxID=44489 RepID=UPI003EB76686